MFITLWSTPSHCWHLCLPDSRYTETPSSWGGLCRASSSDDGSSAIYTVWPVLAILGLHRTATVAELHQVRHPERLQYVLRALLLILQLTHQCFAGLQGLHRPVLVLKGSPRRGRRGDPDSSAPVEHCRMHVRQPGSGNVRLNARCRSAEHVSAEQCECRRQPAPFGLEVITPALNILLPEVCWAPLGLLLLLLLLDALSCISVAVFQGRIQLILKSLHFVCCERAFDLTAANLGDQRLNSGAVLLVDLGCVRDLELMRP